MSLKRSRKWFLFQYFFHVCHKTIFALPCSLCNSCSLWCLLQQHRIKQPRQIRDCCRITEMNAEVWQKFQKLSPPKAGGLSNVHSAQIPKCWVKDGWPVNKRTGKKSMAAGTYTVLLPGARTQPTSSIKLAYLVPKGTLVPGPRGEWGSELDNCCSSLKYLQVVCVLGEWAFQTDTHVKKRTSTRASVSQPAGTLLEPEGYPEDKQEICSKA